MADYQINERVIKLINDLHISAYQFAKDMGLDRPDVIYNIVNKRNGVSNNIIQQIVERFDINKNWLLTGDGKMLKEQSNILNEPAVNYKLPNAEKENFEELYLKQKAVNHEMGLLNLQLSNEVAELRVENRSLKETINKLREICEKCETCKEAIEKNGTIQTPSG